jgi:hypothetical protein
VVGVCLFAAACTCSGSGHARVDNAGSSGLASARVLTDSERNRIVQIALDIPEVKEHAAEPIREMVFHWDVIVWEGSSYSYFFGFYSEDPKTDPMFASVPSSAAWYPALDMRFTDRRDQSVYWRVEAVVDLDNNKAVLVRTMRFNGEFTPAPTIR